MHVLYFKVFTKAYIPSIYIYDSARYEVCTNHKKIADQLHIFG
jgi:hypothetical protein